MHFKRNLFEEEEKVILPCLAGIETAYDMFLALPILPLLLVIIMLINMMTALVVLPLLVYLFKPGFINREHVVMSEALSPEVMEKLKKYG